MKIISLAITMLFCFVAFGQEKTILKTDSIKSKITSCHKTLSEDLLYILDGSVITYETFKAIKPENIESVTILKNSATINLCHRSSNNGVVIIKTKKLSKKELRKMKQNKINDVGCFFD